MHPAVKRLLGLWIDVSLADKAAESGLDMGAWAAEPVVQVEMAERRVQIISPKQADNAAAEPNALRVASRAGQDPGRFGYLVDLFLGLFGGVGGWFGRLRGLAVAVAATLRVGGGAEAQGSHATQHGKELTQLESKPHFPRRMF